MKNNLTEKGIKTINKWAEKYDIKELKINDKEKILNLKQLCIFNTNIKHIPAAIFKLTNLKSLSIYCNNLKQLPKEIHNLIKLKRFDIDCPNSENFPDGIAKLINLETIYIRNCNGKLNLQYLIGGIVKLNNLKSLYIDIE